MLLDMAIGAHNNVKPRLATQQLISIGQAATMLDVSVKTLKTWRKQGKGPPTVLAIRVDRLNKLARGFGSDEKLARASNLCLNNFSRWRTGRRQPTAQSLRQIEQATGKDEGWLADGATWYRQRDLERWLATRGR